MHHKEKIFNRLVLFGCFCLGSYFSAIQFLRYVENEDFSTISYHSLKFDSKSEHSPPTYTLCFTKQSISKSGRGFVGSSFFKHKSLEWEENLTNAECYYEYLKGNDGYSEKRCNTTSEILKKYAGVEFENVVIDLFSQVVLSYNVYTKVGGLVSTQVGLSTPTGMLTYIFTDTNETLKMRQRIDSWRRPHIHHPNIFQKTFQSPDEMCYTRYFDSNGDADFDSDVVFLKHNLVLMAIKLIEIKVYVHQIDQFFRYRHSSNHPQVTDISNANVLNVIEKKGIDVSIDNILSLRRRNKRTPPCNDTLTNEDEIWRAKLEESVNCTPAYWKNGSLSSSLGNKLPDCTLHQYKYIYDNIFKSAEFFNNISKLYIPPCTTLQSTVLTTVNNWDDISNDKRKLFDPRYGIRPGHTALFFRYASNTYMEIKNNKAFDMETLISQTGSYLGILPPYCDLIINIKI